MIGAYYDVEVFSNFVSLLFLDVNTPQSVIDEYIDADIDNDTERKAEILSRITYRWFVFHDDRIDLDFFEFARNLKLLIGFNSNKFDNLLFDYMLIKEDAARNPNAALWFVSELKKLSDSIIESGELNYRYLNEELKKFKPFYFSIDLYTALFETIARKSLKQAAINIKWYRIEDLPLHPDSFITSDQFDDIFEYNFNDVLITRALHVVKRKEFQLRVNIGAKYGVNVLSANRSKIADILMIKFYSEYTGLRYYQFKDKRSVRLQIRFGDILNPKIAFTTPTFQRLHEELLNTTYIVGQKFAKKVVFNGKGYSVMTGGLHSIDRPAVFIADKNRLLKDGDVTSYYPILVENEGAYPAHLAPVAFQAIIRMIIRDRVAAKSLIKTYRNEGRYAESEDQQTAADTLKIVANSGIFGKMGFDGWMYDPKAMYQITLNGQLYLLMWIEQLEQAGIEVISANTDGVVSYFDKSKLEEYERIAREWQKYTKLNLEFTDYYKYVRTSVNDYLAIKTEWLDTKSDDDIKQKGDFLTEVELSKGFNAPIVAIAIYNFYVHGIPIAKTIHEHSDIYDYTISVKTGAAYQKKIHTVTNGLYTTTDVSKNLRYYVSTDGGTLLKHHTGDNRIANMLKGELITPFNDYFRVNTMSGYNINYQYYIRKATEMMLKINGEYTKPSTTRRFTGGKKKGVDQVGKLFDNI